MSRECISNIRLYVNIAILDLCIQGRYSLISKKALLGLLLIIVVVVLTYVVFLHDDIWLRVTPLLVQIQVSENLAERSCEVRQAGMAHEPQPAPISEGHPDLLNEHVGAILDDVDDLLLSLQCDANTLALALKLEVEEREAVLVRCERLTHAPVKADVGEKACDLL